MGLALKGIRILDLTDSIVGPYSTTLLASCGAEVIRVESRLHLGFRRGGSSARGAEGIPQVPESQIDYSKVDMRRLVSPLFTQLNHDKMSVALNLTRPEGRELFKRLVKVSDVVADNFSFDVMQKWGFSYPELQKLRDDIIVINLQAFGRGPYEAWSTWGMNLLSYTGFAYSWGHPDTPMTDRAASSYHGDYIAGTKAALAVVSALWHRAKTGEGQHIQLSQAESAASVLGPSFLDFFVNHRVNPPRGNRHPEFAPYSLYRCQGHDQWCVIAVSSETEWRQFCQAIGQPPWTEDVKFKDMPSRRRNVDELDQNVERWTTQRTPHQVMKFLQEFGVPAGAAQTSEHLYYDLAHRTRGYMFDVDMFGIGKVTYAGVPIRLSDGQKPRWERAPVLGEHNDYVYRQLIGLTADEIKKYEETKVIF